MKAALRLLTIALVPMVCSIGNVLAYAEDVFADKVNLAMRDAGHRLLLHSGDSVTPISPIENLGNGGFVMQIDSGFDYSVMPEILQNSFLRFDVHRSYEIMIRSCETDFIILGYNSAALESDTLACTGRVDDVACAKIHIQFEEGKPMEQKSMAGLAWLLVPVIGIGAALLYKKKDDDSDKKTEPEGLKVGNYLFLPKRQILKLGEEETSLTFRESKLLHHFVIHANEVLAREDILAAVWEDEGVVVGRSLDVFVSRLRKILKTEISVAIKTVHGVGYRLEVEDRP